jgi:hypothetical protein
MFGTSPCSFWNTASSFFFTLIPFLDSYHKSCWGTVQLTCHVSAVAVSLLMMMKTMTSRNDERKRLVDCNILAECTAEQGRAGSIDSYLCLTEHLMFGMKPSSTPMLCLYFHRISWRNQTEMIIGHILMRHFNQKNNGITSKQIPKVLWSSHLLCESSSLFKCVLQGIKFWLLCCMHQVKVVVGSVHHNKNY